MHFSIKHETVLPSLKDDCHPGLADFRHDQFPTRDDIEAEKKMLLKHWIPFRLMLYIQSNFQLKTNHENAQTLIQQFFFLMVIMRIRLGVEDRKKNSRPN